MSGLVYLLTNPAMPGLVKIGKTTRADPIVRMKELYSSPGVPVPFECACAIEVDDETAVELALHTAFGPYRTNPRREFFNIDSLQAEAILRQMGGEDKTPEVNAENQTIDQESRKAATRLLQRRPNMNFLEMGIPIGSCLTAVDYDETVIVVAEKKVSFKDQEMSLSRATREMRGHEYSVMPTPYWSFDGRSLRDIYDETYSFD